MRRSFEDAAQWLAQATGLPPQVWTNLLLTAAAWAIYAALRLTLSRLLHRRVEDVSRRYVIGKSLNYGLGAAFVVATLVIWFGNFSGWAAYLGILSAGLAIALQDPVTNLAGWVFITLRKPFAVGDRIEIGGHRGDVIDLRLFQFTLLEIGNWVDSDQSTGRIIHVPNGWAFKHSLANYTQGFNFIWNELPVTVTFESDWRKAKRILTEIAERHSPLQSKKAREEVGRAARSFLIHFQHLTPIVWTSVADSGVTLTVRYLCAPHRRRSSAGRLWEEILTAFAAEPDIDFAYPTTRFYDNRLEGKPGARAGETEHSPGS